MQTECPVIVLTSGQTLKLQSVKLYDAARVNGIATLKAAAVQNMGPVSTGIGFWGSPGWALGGADALGFIEALAAKANRTAAIEQLRRAESAYRAMLRGARYFAAKGVSNFQSPHPDTWAAFDVGSRFIHSGDDFVDVGTDLGTLSVRWSEVVAYYPPQAEVSDQAIIEPQPSIRGPAPMASWQLPSSSHGSSLMVECKNCGRESITGTRVCPDCERPLF